MNVNTIYVTGLENQYDLSFLSFFTQIREKSVRFQDRKKT